MDNLRDTSLATYSSPVPSKKLAELHYKARAVGPDNRCGNTVLCASACACKQDSSDMLAVL